MNINISISETSESKPIQLLTNIINCLQSEKEDLVTKCTTLEKEKETLETTYSTLEGENKKLDNKCTSLEKEKETLETTCSTLEGENKKLDEKCTTLEKEKETLETTCSTLEGENKKLDEKCTTLGKEKETLETTCSTLEGENKKLDEKCIALENEKNVMDEQIKIYSQEKKDRFFASIKQVSEMLQYSLTSGTLNEEWNEHIEIITNDIKEFISEDETIDDITQKMKSKNGWFAKVASIHWWSVASSVRDYLPPLFRLGSGFHFSFCNLLDELKLSGVDVIIPDCDFSREIDNYRRDYSKDPVVQKLFPEYKPDGFVLCEIIYVSFNGGTGACIGYK